MGNIRGELSEPSADRFSDARELRALVAELQPVIRARAARAIRRRPQHGAAEREHGQELEELTQEVFMALFAHDARALRAWDPNRGLSLHNFAGLVAERVVSNVLHSRRRRPWSDVANADELDDVVSQADLESGVNARQLVAQLFARMARDMSPTAARYFSLLFLEERSVAETCLETGSSRDAVYAWRSRLSRSARAILLQLHAANDNGD